MVPVLDSIICIYRSRVQTQESRITQQNLVSKIYTNTMMSNILILVLVLVLLFIVYQFVISKVESYRYGEDDTDSDSDSDAEESFRDEPNQQPRAISMPPGQKSAMMEENRVVSSGGPNPPAHAAPQGQAVVMPPEQPYDPYAEKQQDAYGAGDDSRHPERMFRPAPEAGDSATAVAGGIAGRIGGSQYSVDGVINGAEFMPGVVTADLTDSMGGDLGFSSF
jgi:hypothetical protein